MLLSIELQKYYEGQFSMMASEGWKDLCEDLKAVHEGLSDIKTVTTETLLNRQGRIAEIDCILNRMATLSTAFDELTVAGESL